MVQQFDAAADFPSMALEGRDNVFSVRQSGFRFRVLVTCRMCQRSFVAAHARLSVTLAPCEKRVSTSRQHELTCAGNENALGVYGRLTERRGRSELPAIDEDVMARPIPESALCQSLPR